MIDTLLPLLLLGEMPFRISCYLLPCCLLLYNCLVSCYPFVLPHTRIPLFASCFFGSLASLLLLLSYPMGNTN